MPAVNQPDLAPDERPRRIHSRKMFEALKAAGIIRDGDYVRRVIIDINVECAVVVYVERYGDERLLNVATALGGVEITRAEEQKAETAHGDVAELRAWLAAVDTEGMTVAELIARIGETFPPAHVGGSSD